MVIRGQSLETVVTLYTLYTLLPYLLYILQLNPTASPGIRPYRSGRVNSFSLPEHLLYR